jgi:hypothetical protein
VAFLIAAAFLMWRVRERIVRLAFGALFVEQAILAYADLSATTPNSFLVGIPLIAFALFMGAAGASQVRPRRVAMIASAAFVAMFLLSWGARYYADVVIGRHSIVRSSPICLVHDLVFTAKPRLDPTAATKRNRYFEAPANGRRASADDVSRA